jgi:hypothetical protein
MRTKLTCKRCNHQDLYDKYDCKNIGTFASPVWAVKCVNCSEFILTSTESENNKFPTNKELKLTKDKESGGIKIESEKNKPISTKPNAFDRANTGDIKEYWVQQYFLEYHTDLGFKDIEGPFDIGPDFKTKNGIGIEVERTWKFYLKHKHHENKSFSNVRYLVVLSPEKPSFDKMKYLPKEILYLDIDKFVPWFRNKCKEFMETKSVEIEKEQIFLRIKLLAGEFNKRYINICPDKKREMSTCSNCQICAYEPEINFADWAIDYIIKNDIMIFNDDYSFEDLDYKTVNDFFDDMINL